MEDSGLIPPDLTPDERLELESIRRRKLELMAEIQRLRDELKEAMFEVEGLEINEGSKTLQRSKQMAMGRKKFNMDPKKGIQFLVENDLLKNVAEEIAQFLYKGEGLNKTAIGDYLGERDEFNIKVLHAFVELHEFTDLNLVQALRQFLWSFRLPGEAQKIDRMMEAFAQRYCHCNPGVFQSTDTCYVLSFAIIMLNTSLHNPNVRDKPTVERFISMNRGINDGGDLPEELLRNLHESIKNEPFKIPEDDGNDLTHTFFNPDREGWLLKLGGRVKTWKRRWFILTDNCLYYFEYTTDKEPRGIIPLENLSIREVEDPRKPGSCQHRPVLRDACCAEEAHLSEEGGTALMDGGGEGAGSSPARKEKGRVNLCPITPSPPPVTAVSRGLVFKKLEDETFQTRDQSPVEVLSSLPFIFPSPLSIATTPGDSTYVAEREDGPISSPGPRTILHPPPTPLPSLQVGSGGRWREGEDLVSLPVFRNFTDF
ncbi:cytohesin-2 isoform X1 [Mobula birostris]|uniref:cytohesin-2 isoform X1 n=2 Tax=Myliobatiformes TaxID=117851 RepID=UPI003B288E4C